MSEETLYQGKWIIGYIIFSVGGGKGVREVINVRSS